MLGRRRSGLRATSAAADVRVARVLGCADMGDRYLPMLLERIEKSEIDPSFVITHRASLEQRPELYKTFRDKKDGCIKLVMKP